jgi:predicted nucleic acid-binding protein
MPTGKKIFIDTNVLVYANWDTSPFHVESMAALSGLAGHYDSIWINRQVIREYLKVMSLVMLKNGHVDYAQLQSDISRFTANFNVAETNHATTARLLTLIEETATSGKQVYDANIVTTMLAYDVDFILTHNVADFKRFSHLITVVPLI